MFPNTGQQSSVFGGAATNQPAKRSLLDLGDSQSQQQPQQQQPQRSNPFGSLLPSAPAVTSQPATTPSFGQTTTQNTLGSSLLGNQPGAQTQSQSQPATQPIAASQSTQPAYFSSLLERGKKRPHASTGDAASADLPNLQLGLDDIRRAARGLGAPGERRGLGGKWPDNKAHYSLAASGISPGQVLQDLKMLGSQTTASSPFKSTDTFDPDNQKFLRQVQQRGREAMVAESLARVRKDFDAFLEEKVNVNWDEQRKKIYEHFGLMSRDDSARGTSDSSSRGSFGKSAALGRSAGGTGMPRGGDAIGRRSIFGRSALGKSVIGSPSVNGRTSQYLSDSAMRNEEGAGVASADSRFLREKLRHFANSVQELNEARLQERTFPILHRFAETERVAGGDVPRQLFEAYHALISMVNESPNSASLSEPGVLKERQFAGDYLDDSLHSVGATRMRKRIIEGSRKFLEQLFHKEVESIITKNPREAQLGGVPSITNKIRAYIRLRAARKDLAPDGTELQMVGQDYCWILIFYLLRCGFVKEAAEYVSQDPGFRSLDHKFVTYMTTYAQNRRLPRDLQQKINGEYQQRLRNAPENTVDPYRMACYKIIGRCDLSQRRFDGIGQGVEDWMWLQFVFAREDSRTEEVAGELFGLEEIQSDISEIGLRVFGKGQDGPGGYGTFFLLQILGGMFEQAVSCLAHHEPISAVHFAIALDFYGLLRVSDFFASGEDLLTFSTKQLPQINFASLITQYTREFRTGYVEAAVNYFTLICLNADLPGELGKSQASVCHEALREFILETRDFALLLGDIRSDGTRIKGAIERRLKLIKLIDQEEFLKTITVQAAAVADDKGLITDAVLLYHLAEEYDNVISVINRALADAIAVDLGDSAMKLQPLKPRTTPSSQEQPQQPQQASTLPEQGSSLSLTAVDDPVVLAKNMIGLYNTNALYYQKIHQINRDACGLLLRTMEAKANVAAGKWAQALDDINNLQILPLRAQGSVTYIRSAAQAFPSLPPVISRNAGQLIMWSMMCIGRERERLQQGAYANGMRQSLADELLVMAKDLMVFAGMIKYKLPPRVYEMLAKAGGEIGL
ncbi:meiotically up-regulated gene 87 protein [Histoplasma capsulatum G186AR]|uniref:Meiotically up-regulated gene 87 protein n=2 Tax=Ajellomyces capsulatus TaxID=5037 RepID=C0NYU4_AJECG|nr:meiotically up-regulated gene 87 protein [Histoplasma capsulatum G186AR]EEH03384.1 meiotically up-regulated gene 87 protein [Histoplasma capsulatum G186AR]KAG5295794.1 meiotically up-regulated gene 87 protein [Histoplasma capsulatum]QSS73776.1 meiotically up-regulated gene 87 protein [Histoplasma capsulatum G186AR]